MTKPPARLLDFLAAQGAAYRLVHHPTVFTAQELAAVTGVKGRQLAKVVLVTDGAALWMTVLPADCRLDLDKLAGHLGRSVQLAREDQFRAQFPDCAAGAVPPFGGLYGVPTLVDERLLAGPMIAFAAGTHTDSAQMTSADYRRVAQPELMDLVVPIASAKETL